MLAVDPRYTAEMTATELARARFAADFGVKRRRWSGRNVSRLLRSTGERPARVDELWEALAALGMGSDRAYPCQGGVWDHGELWFRDGRPFAVVGQPYRITPENSRLLSLLAVRFSTIRVSVDDRPSYYGFGSRHVRIEVPEPRKPWNPGLATEKTREAARAAREAFREAFAS